MYIPGMPVARPWPKAKAGFAAAAAASDSACCPCWPWLGVSGRWVAPARRTCKRPTWHHFLKRWENKSIISCKRSRTVALHIWYKFWISYFEYSTLSVSRTYKEKQANEFAHRCDKVYVCFINDNEHEVKENLKVVTFVIQINWTHVLPWQIHLLLAYITLRHSINVSMNTSKPVV